MEFFTQFPQYPFMGGIRSALRQRAPWPHRLLSSAGASFHGLGCRKFPISVGLGARGTRVQFTNFPDRCTTSSTGHG